MLSGTYIYYAQNYASIIGWCLADTGHNREDSWEIPESIIGKFCA